MLGGERNRKGEETELSGMGNLRLVESIAGLSLYLGLGRGKASLVVWLLCFSDLQLEPHYLTLGFYYSCNTLPCSDCILVASSRCFQGLPSR